MITCSALRYDLDEPAPAEPAPEGGERVEPEIREPQTCGATATVRVTIRGADRGRDQRPGSESMSWNLERAPRCALCARMDERIAARFYIGASFDSEPITVQ